MTKPAVWRVDLGGRFLEHLERLREFRVARFLEEIRPEADHCAVGEPGQRVERVPALERRHRSRGEIRHIERPLVGELGVVDEGIEWLGPPRGDPAAGADEDHLHDVVGPGAAGQLEILALVQDRERHLVDLHLDARLLLEGGQPRQQGFRVRVRDLRDLEPGARVGLASLGE